MDHQELDAETKCVVASNLTAAYFAAVEKQTRHADPDPTERQHIYNEILRVYSDFLSRFEKS